MRILGTVFNGNILNTQCWSFSALCGTVDLSLTTGKRTRNTERQTNGHRTKWTQQTDRHTERPVETGRPGNLRYAGFPHQLVGAPHHHLLQESGNHSKVQGRNDGRFNPHLPGGSSYDSYDPYEVEAYMFNPTFVTYRPQDTIHPFNLYPKRDYKNVIFGRFAQTTTEIWELCEKLSWLFR